MAEPQKYKLTARQKRMLSDYHQRQHATVQTVEPSIGAIDSVESIYKALNDRDKIKAKAVLMLMLRNWLIEISNFDPVSGDAMNTSIVDFLDAVAKLARDKSSENGEIKDRIHRIVVHSKESILAIMEHIRDKILREHAMLPIHAVREVDSNSIQWLSRQPGRTFREKLSGKPYMKAVRRRSSVDTAENRLLKAFLFRLEQVLIERQNVLSVEIEDACEELLVFIQRWLRTEDAAEIGAWENVPPNNTLLQDKRYRKVWDSWLWLRVIDEQIAEDSKRVYRDILNVIYWNTLSLLNDSGRFRTVQQPIRLDYDNFTISPELPVRGYLFPVYDSKINGKIKFINPNKSFGFIISNDERDLYFSPNNLTQKLDINSLSTGDEVVFVIGSNQKGECADNIALPAEIILVDFKLMGDKWKIQVGEDKYLLQIVSGNFVIEQARGEKKKFKIESTTIQELPKVILELITGLPLKYTQISSQKVPFIKTDNAIVDLCSIRPMIITSNGSWMHLPFRLLQQIWTLKDQSELAIDCAEAKAIIFDSDIETISIRSLFSHSSTLSDATKSSASMFFTKKLSDYIKTDKLTYLVPDRGNDFDLEAIRKSVNFYFNKSTPLPKSIAAIFAWQSSKKFVQDKVRENDLVLVVDSFDGSISITPVQAKYQPKLAEILPETQGISWERHPTFFVPNRDIDNVMVNNLNSDGCQASEELLHLFGFDGLASDAGEISFVKDDHWYHLPTSIREVLTKNLDSNILSNKDIINCQNLINESNPATNIFIIPLEDTIKKPNGRMNYIWLGSAWLPVKGGQILDKWQEKADNIALWRDHLPELSIRTVCNGHFENFYLVKDATVTPQRDRTVNIPVEKSFTLPAGQTHYNFSLWQGEGNKELQFVAYLRSPAFPLKKDTVCTLKMTYTYGADDPYELKFIPLDSVEAGFKSIRAEWRSASEGNAADLETLPVPDFPARKSWSDFQKYPKENDKDFSNLLEWVKRDLNKISDILRYGRIKGSISKWIDKGDDNIFCFIEDVFVHKSSLSLRKSQKLPQEGDVLTFYKITDSQGKSSAADVTIGEEQPKNCFLSKSLRFPVLTIWNHGHSLSESDVPDHFRNVISEGTQKIISIIESENLPVSLKDELFFFLCCLHKDAPDIVRSRLLEAVKNEEGLQKYQRNIAFAMGAVELPWQQELFKNIINPINNKNLTRSITMKVLSIALWRSKTLINKLTKEELGALSRNLYSCLEFDIKRVVKGGKGYQIATLCKHLELLLALLRSRGIESEEFKMIFAPDNELTKKYVALVDDISKIVSDSDIELKSRISLQIKKPEIFHNTPDLLYALRMYLTGDTGSNAIVITGVNDED